jgi:hypothetical protein
MAWLSLKSDSQKRLTPPPDSLQQPLPSAAPTAAPSSFAIYSMTVSVSNFFYGTTSGSRSTVPSGRHAAFADTGPDKIAHTGPDKIAHCVSVRGPFGIDLPGDLFGVYWQQEFCAHEDSCDDALQSRTSAPTCCPLTVHVKKPYPKGPKVRHSLKCKG